jgi:hypothetical protein
MPNRTVVKLDSLIFDKARREQALTAAVSKTTVQFAASTAEKMVEGPQTGILYGRRRGRDFTRSHRASAKGQRPAVDSGNLLHSIKHQMAGAFTGEVTTIVPGPFDYAAQLQDKMSRPIQSDEDAKEAETLLAANCKEALDK